MNKVQDNIALKLLTMLKDEFQWDYIDVWEEIKDKPLLGYDMGMRPRHLVYLFFSIEKYFGITIHEKYIIDGRFNTLANIVEIIKEELECGKEVRIENAG
ncbi:MAG TPA: peptide maturation system acyl carrier-related protein [Acetivibrio sp.]|uniref:peptide maturation system acyl carrier-related protein n=1 Tax=Acetivibrio sp. TaxID=1872092 RepID=UPI002C128811|nr:peptide maturation system acyl carrier-related protein [Acetivibrio sp.]HOM03449.1 peptide maturation system acyl carrier-related protein [Acetivibrio sp.]